MIKLKSNKSTTLFLAAMMHCISRLNFFQMVLTSIGLEKFRTPISIFSYILIDLFIVATFFKEVYTDKKLFTTGIVIGFLYMIPNIYKMNFYGAIKDLIFVFIIVLIYTLLMKEEKNIKVFFENFVKYSPYMAILSILYILYLIFGYDSSNITAYLPYFSYGNVAWFFIPFYLGISFYFIADKKIKQKLYKYNLLYLAIISIGICYTGLRTAIFVMFFSTICIFIFLTIANPKDIKKYILKSITVFLITALTVFSSSKIEIEGSRNKAFKSGLIYEETSRENIFDDKDLKDKKLEDALTNITQKSKVGLNIIYDVKNQKYETLENFMKDFIIISKLSEKEAQSIIHEDVLNEKREYIIVNPEIKYSVCEYELRRDRVNLWSTARGEFKKSPIFGNGILHYQSKYVGTHPHNAVLEMLSDFGIVGFMISLIIFLITATISIKKLYKSKKIYYAIIFAFTLSFLPAILLYTSLYSNEFIISIVTVFVIFSIHFKDKKQIHKKELL